MWNVNQHQLKVNPHGHFFFNFNKQAVLYFVGIRVFVWKSSWIFDNHFNVNRCVFSDSVNVLPSVEGLSLSVSVVGRLQNTTTIP